MKRNFAQALGLSEPGKYSEQRDELRVGTGERSLNGVKGLLLARAETHQWSPPSGHW